MIGDYLQEGMARPAVSIVVPCHNEKDHIEICALNSGTETTAPRGG